MSRETLNTQFWKACRILRQDDNTNSLLDYVEQISWLLFLKCFEEFEAQRKAEAEYEGRNHSAILAQKYQWSTWTNPDPSKKLTGQDLLKFLYDDLFPYLRNLQGNSARSVIRGLFKDAPSKMLKDGAILRDAIDAVQEITFESAEDVHTLSHLYESMLAKLGREGGMGGEFYTPRPIIEFVVQMVNPKIGQTVYDPAMGSAGFLVEAYKHMRATKGNRILPKDEKRLQNETFYGQEKKALPYLLGCMNMILHGVFSSNLRRHNTLADDVRKFSEKDRYDVILTAVRGFEYRPEAIKRTSLPTVDDAHYWLSKGDVLITRSNSIELVGHAAIYNGKPSPCIYPDLMMRLPIDRNKVLGEFLIFWLQSSVVRDYVRANAKGTSPSMKKINQGVVMNIPFPTGLAVTEQRRLIKEFQEYALRIRSLRLVHEQAAQNLNAMLPAVLGRAFRGELVEVPA